MVFMPFREASPARSRQGQNLKAAETSVGLATLPTETLEHIFGNFCVHCRYNSKPDAYVTSTDSSSLPGGYFRDRHERPGEPSWDSVDRHVLFSLCLVSRRFRDIAQPFLYHEFALGAGDWWCAARYTWVGRLPSFLRTVTERRDLAGLVRQVFVHPSLLEKWFVMVDGEVDQAGAAAAIAALHHSARLLGIRPESYLNQFYPKQTPGTKYITHEMLQVTSSQLLEVLMDRHCLLQLLRSCLKKETESRIRVLYEKMTDQSSMH